jgi:hypothetical protein
MPSSSHELSHRLRRLHSVLSDLSQRSNQVLNDEALEKFKLKSERAQNLNPWFTEENIDKALRGLTHMLRPEAVEKWLSDYELGRDGKKRIGLILAGNLPMVGFHDILSVLVTGHHPVVKLSSQDRLLLPEVFDLHAQAFPEAPFEITWLGDDKLTDIDAVIATGSNNTSRYFEYYFGKYPHIIRKNRNAVAVLSGEETEAELRDLGEDIFSYYGLGCRNVAKLFVHEDFDLDRFFRSIYDYHPIINHHKYANNYDYYKALWLMNREELLDNGFLILRPSEATSSPVGTLFYERFRERDQLLDRISSAEEAIQCIVSKNDVPFGKSQMPELWDYADGVDTVRFLEEV